MNWSKQGVRPQLRAPEFWMVTVASLADLAILAYLDGRYGYRMGRIAPLLWLFVPALIVVGYLWLLVLSNLVRSKLYDPESAAPEKELSAQQVALKVLVPGAFYCSFYFVIALGLLLGCVGHLLAFGHQQ